MAENSSDHDTFVSVEKYAADVPTSDRVVDPDQQLTAPLASYLGSAFDGEDMLNHAREDTRAQQSVSHSHVEDHSAFMWGLSARDSAADLADNTDELDSTLDATGSGPQKTSSTDPGNPSITVYTDVRQNREGSAPFERNVAAFSEREDDLYSDRDRILQESQGLTSCEIRNPFPTNGTSRPRPQLVIFSRKGSLAEDELVALERLAGDSNSPEALVLERLVETIEFQRFQIQDLKDAEMQMADRILHSETRRHSEVERERSIAINTLIEDLDIERTRTCVVEDENAKLQVLLQEAQGQVEQVIEYYSQFDENFNFSNGVCPALQMINNRVDSVLREKDDIIEHQQNELTECAERLANIDAVVAGHRTRCEELRQENEDLKSQVLFREAHDAERDPPVLSPRRVSAKVDDFGQDRAEFQHKLEEQEQEIKTLRALLDRARADEKRVHDAFLSLNVDLEDARSKTKFLLQQRDAAENKCRDLSRDATTQREKYFQFSKEMSENLVNVVNDLESKEAELVRLRSEMEDREQAFNSLRSTVQELEEQLERVTNAAIAKSKKAVSQAEGEMSSERGVVDSIVESLRAEVSKAQVVLKERGDEIAKLKRQIRSQHNSMLALQRESRRLRSAASVRRASNIRSPLSTASDAHIEEQQAAFLRRLSAKLGCHSDNRSELVGKLSERIEVLVSERSDYERAADRLRGEVRSREQAIHAVRSEMQAEISSLKAEVAHLENVKQRANEERKAAESKLLDLLGERDISRRESIAEVTSSSVGHRGWSIGEDGEQASRRESMFSTLAGDESVKWNDPIIEAAVQSLNALIGTKDELAARNRELREKLDSLFSEMAAHDETTDASRSVIIQSRDLQDELARVVGMQQDILQKVVDSAHSPRQDVTEDDTLPYLREELSPSRAQPGGHELSVIAVRHAARQGNSLSTAPVLASGSSVVNSGIGEAAGFLSEQLSETRLLYNEKLRANAKLCGVVNELEQEIKHLKNANSNTEDALSKLNEAHEEFIFRLASITGADNSAVAVEDFIRHAMHEMTSIKTDIDTRHGQEAALMGRITNLIAQKRVLAHVIDIYQSKYRLDILTLSRVETESPRRRFRSRVFALIAIGKLGKFSAEPSHQPLSARIDIEEVYNVPTMAAIARYRASGISLLDASVAVAAVPRLEAAVVAREEENSSLQDSLEALNRSLALARESAGSPKKDLPSAYVYEDDVITRKKDLSIRLRNIITDKEELETRLSREKQMRIAAEARSSRYLDKVSILKRKLGKTTSQAESKERTYKAAIRYLKYKADKAIDDDFNMDENVAPWNNSEAPNAGDNIALPKKKPNAETRDALRLHLATAEASLADAGPDTAANEKLEKYIRGLRRAIQRLDKSMLSSRTVPYTNTASGRVAKSSST